MGKKLLVSIILGILCLNIFAQTSSQNGIFYFGLDIIGIIVNNKIHFYEYDKNWENIPELEMTLPDGYRNVFGFGDCIIGVIVNDKVHFYEYDGNFFGSYDGNWINIPELEMTLPDGYRNVFGYGNNVYIGVIVNNKIHFFAYDAYKVYDGGWITISELEMVLPDGF